jgi:signal transduction histidine kinase
VPSDTKTINSIYEEAMLLNRLIDDLQELTLAESGQLRLMRSATAPAQIVTTVVAAAAPQAAERGLTLRTEIDPDLPYINVDAQRIGQALRNLIVNAIAHTPPGGEVVVSAASTDESVTISVRDTGEGIAPDHLPHLFERFYRADSSRSRSTGGSGLGLAIVKQWVEAHDGTITIESELGSGSTFTITLPQSSNS